MTDPHADPLGPAEAAAHVGVTRQTIHRWEQAGHLARIDAGGAPRYRAADVERAAAAQRPRRDPDHVRALIVGAAATLARREGTAACTIDGVAAETGLSRSGVLHHFRHKRELLDAMVAAFLTRFEERWAQAEAAVEPGSGQVGRAYVSATAGPDDDLVAALLVCAVEEPETLRPVQRRLRVWYRRIADDGGDEAVAAALAADALWLLPLLGLTPLPRRDASALLARLAGHDGPPAP